MAPFEASSLTLEVVLGDLQTIATTVIAEQDGGTASYEDVQQQLGNLSLHALTYIRFLENHGYVSYDRGSDRITITPLGRAAAQDSAVWREQAAVEFLDQGGYDSEDHTSLGDPLGDLSDEVDGILDSLSEIDVEAALNEASNSDASSTSELAAQPAPSSMFEADSADSTNPEIATPAAQPAAQKDFRNTSQSMSNDSFSSRRLSTQTPAVSRPGAASGGGARLYDREGPIGSGGMGTVYRGVQVKLNRAVAIKEIKEIFDVFAGVQRNDIVDRFTEIVQTQASLLHPNIIQLVDLDVDAQYPFVVMQYAPNGNLRRLIESEGRPPLQIALKYFLQILHALNTAHDNGVTHGGIKPENVVLDHAGNALMTDFGISRVAELDANANGAHQVYVGVGTVAYMSPEQFRDPNSSSVKSDIYSLGIMFYEMLTGKVPGRRSPMPSSFFPDIPRALDDVFDRMSMDDINERYESVEEVLTDIYNSDEVMGALDKRGGFLFLRDPITHGEAGGVALFDDDSPAVARPAPAPAAAAAPAPAQAAAAAPATAPVEEDAEEDVAEAAGAVSGAEGDVLDKLNKYSGMFDDDADSEADDSDADDSDADDSDADASGDDD